MKAVNIILDRIEEVFVILALAVASTLTFVEVILRQFGSSLGFTFEMVNYLLIWTGFIGASIGVREKTHLGVDILIANCEPKVQKALLILISLLSVIFSVIVSYLGFQHVLIVADFGQVSPEMELPLYVVRSLIPIAFGLMTIRFLQETYRVWKTSAEQLVQEGGIINE